MKNYVAIVLVISLFVSTFAQPIGEGNDLDIRQKRGFIRNTLVGALGGAGIGAVASKSGNRKSGALKGGAIGAIGGAAYSFIKGK